MWGKIHHNTFDEIKIMISKALLLTLPKLHNPFKVEIDASGYDMGVVLM
jgi:hypothetical protein